MRLWSLSNAGRHSILSILSVAAFGLSACHSERCSAATSLEECNVVWETPSGDSSGSMPIGNGDIGLNVWTEDNGDLLLLISKTDSWDENNELFKLGRIRVVLSDAEQGASPFGKGEFLRQQLRLREGCIEIVGGKRNARSILRVWVDANRPVIRVESESRAKLAMTVKLEVWRTEPRMFTEVEFGSNRDVETADKGVVTPDVVVDDVGDSLTWYHRNESSIWPVGMRLQGMESVMDQFADPLLRRTFGATVRGEGFAKKDSKTLSSVGASTHHCVGIYPLTTQTPTVAAFLSQIKDQAVAVDAVAIAEARRQHEEWWGNFWDRSWIRVSGDNDAQKVAQAYTLQRWISACNGRGNAPIKFNGSIFTVEWREKGKIKSNPDYRRWGSAYWWQNTRLPYWPMLASGDYDLMQPMFKMYMDSLPLAMARNRIWFNCEGAFMPETMNSWGMYCNIDYGWKRDGLAVSEMVNPYIRWIYSSGLDLTMMMLDYYEHTGDEKMAREMLVPWADAMLRYFDTRYKRDAEGKLLLDPTQSIETYQSGVTNDTPTVAGLHAVLPRLLSLPAELTGEEIRTRWTRLLGEIPELPIGERAGKRVILPAKTFGDRGNCENPELYTIFPFRIYGVDKPDLQLAQNTYDARVEKSFFGWQQTATQAAMLGRADEARRMLVENAKGKDKESRFPAFWGPNYDWVPDQDHGGNILNALQSMILLAEGRRIVLFPAWPSGWDVDFKLHAPFKTVVEGKVRDGKLSELSVTPPERMKDVTVMSVEREIPASQ